MVAAAALVIFVVVPIDSAIWLTSKPRQHVTATLGVPHSDVTLHTKDDVRLTGWYVPSRNGAAIVLVHGGGGGNRGGAVRHAQLLAAHGYGVLLYDERGRGGSSGQTNGMGWDWDRDVTAAVDWLAARGIARVGTLGLSTGAEAVITQAAYDPRVHAVVAEGVIGRSSTDTKLQGDWSADLYWRIAFLTIAAQTGDSEPQPLTSELRRLAPRPLLLIASGTDAPETKPLNAFRRAGGPTMQVWVVHAGHTAASKTFPQEYARRVLGFFDRALRMHS